MGSQKALVPNKKVLSTTCFSHAILLVMHVKIPIKSYFTYSIFRALYGETLNSLGLARGA